ncbi:MAG TPA: universal stress protein [Syntrophorhabdaceae bacterium]|jgi:nucleotide-binding universal stress UspA family protein
MVACKNILFSTDFSGHAGAAVPFAVDLAMKYGALLHVVHVYLEAGHIAEFESRPRGDGDTRLIQPTGKEAEKKLDRLCEEISKELGSCRKKLLRGKPAAEIVRYAKEEGIDLIVMSSHGLTGLSHALFGSTAEKVVRESPCSVCVIKSKNDSLNKSNMHEEEEQNNEGIEE